MTRCAWAYARAADARGVDIIQNCEVTGIKIDNGKVARRRYDARLHRLQKARLGSGRQFLGGRPPWRGCDCRSKVTSCRRSYPKASSPYIDGVVTFGAGPLLRFAVRQGRTRLRRRHRRLQFLCAARQSGDGRARDRSRRRDDSGTCARARAAKLGRYRRHVDGRLADHRQDRTLRVSISTPAGATAASRRRRPPAGVLLTRSPATKPHSLNASVSARSLSPRLHD